MSFGEDDDRSIGKTDFEVGIFLDDLFCARKIRRIEWLESICAADNFVEKGRLSAVADVAHEEIVELSQDERR